LTSTHNAALISRLAAKNACGYAKDIFSESWRPWRLGGFVLAAIGYNSRRSRITDQQHNS
jgi:hypothetical protein